jgi:CHAT domain-containing protein
VEPETRALRALFPDAVVLEGAEATSERFVERAPRASWIHFAGHGQYHAEDPEFSALRFADRWMPASEIAPLALGARWVTLSACQTGRALVRPGEEWFGLPRALLLAGAEVVIASPWDVHDDAAAALMRDTYREIARGHSPVDALAIAQASLARADRHPLEWAGFSPYGGVGALTQDS